MFISASSPPASLGHGCDYSVLLMGKLSNGAILGKPDWQGTGGLQVQVRTPLPEHRPGIQQALRECSRVGEAEGSAGGRVREGGTVTLRGG